MKKASASPNMRIAKRIFACLAIIFLLLFLGKLIYNLVPASRGSSTYYDMDYFFGEYGIAANNFATNHMETSALTDVPDLDQKYERIAKLDVKTLEFDVDLKKSQTAIQEHGGLIQTENSSGLAGGRQVKLTIGVPPEGFDALLADLAKIGEVTGTNTVARDMTNEYRQLLAEQEGLARRLGSYEAIKARGGSVQEMLAVEALIIEADRELQKLQVSLADYSGEQALCTVDFTLYEGSRFNLGREVWDAVVWAAGAFAIAAGIALLAALLSLAVAVLWNYMKHLGQKNESN